VFAARALICHIALPFQAGSMKWFASCGPGAAIRVRHVAQKEDQFGSFWIA
jgi:hypothetical protein